MNRSLVVLVIDDDPLVRNTIAAMLQSKGHEISLSMNGADGVEQLRRKTFDLVITDLMMPQMGGLEAISEISKLAPRQRVLAISGGGRQSSGVDLLDIAERFHPVTLRKPFSKDELLDAVARAVA